MRAFRAAVEAGDIDAAVALLATHVTFRSPAVHEAYRGADEVAVILRAAAEVFEDFRYVRQVGAEDAADQALVFRARVGHWELEGVDLLHVDEDGLIDDFAVMVRPLSGLLALAEAMRERLEGPS